MNDGNSSKTNLPVEVQALLNNQMRAMKHVYLEFSEKWEGIGTNANNYRGSNNQAIWFEANRFYVRKSNGPDPLVPKALRRIEEFAFDGDLFYVGNFEEETERPDYRVLIKYLVSDKGDPERNQLMLTFPYFDAAGFYAPQRISDMEEFSGIETLVLRSLGQAITSQVQLSNNSLRLTARVPDRYLNEMREANLVKVQKELNSTANSRAFISAWMKAYERYREMRPERIITFVLDAEHGYGVAEREERTASGERIRRIECNDWKYYSNASLWLPGRCVTFYYTPPSLIFSHFSDEVIMTITTELTLAEFESREVQFSLDQKATYRKPGTMIVDRSVPEARVRPDYRVAYPIPADERLLRSTAELLLMRRRFWIGFLVLLSLPPLVLLIQHWRKSLRKT